MKLCRRCGNSKPHAEFYKSSASKDGLYPYCKACKNADNRAWKQANKDKHNEHSRKWREKNGETWKWTIIKSKYGLTQEQYEAILARQGGLCAVCRKLPGMKGFHIDHDHSCCDAKGSCGKCVRGLLCFSCNTGIGILGDSPQVLMNAAAYLQGDKLTLEPAEDIIVV